MSKVYHLFDYVDKNKEKPTIVRKYMNMADRSFTLEEYEVGKAKLPLYNRAFNGQRVEGYVSSGRYVLIGIFADLNDYSL